MSAACQSALRIDGVPDKPEDDIIEVCASTLDNPNAVHPDFAVFTRRAPTWAAFPKDLPLHEYGRWGRRRRHTQGGHCEAQRAVAIQGG